MKHLEKKIKFDAEQFVASSEDDAEQYAASSEDDAEQYTASSEDDAEQTVDERHRTVHREQRGGNREL